ncbi:MAG: hypothetical protein FJX74_15385 [Armatimonadetes bacterium]|nr:hypothetical protein [Armatimonadota bacterium]
MSDLRDRIKGDESSFQRLLDWIPGFKGYREQGMRREADRLVREHLVGLLADTHGKVRRATGDLAKKARLKHLGAIDSVGKRIETLTDLVRYADAGYAGWFSAVKVREEELDRLYEYDVSLKQFIADLDAAVTELVALPEDDMPGGLDKVNAALDELDHMVKSREQVALDLVP